MNPEIHVALHLAVLTANAEKLMTKLCALAYRITQEAHPYVGPNVWLIPNAQQIKPVLITLVRILAQELAASILNVL